MFKKLRYYHIYETKYGPMIVMSQERKLNETPAELKLVDPVYKGKMNFNSFKPHQKKRLINQQYGAFLHYNKAGTPQRFKEKNLVTRLY